MLVLSRKFRERIHIGENIVIEIVEIRGKTVRLGITAPTEIPIKKSGIDEDSNVKDVGNASDNARE